MLKKILLIFIPIIIVTALIFTYGIRTYNEKFVVFQSNGHFFAENNNKSTEKYFFDTNAKYKKADDSIIIETGDNKKFTIPAETFVHYQDGSISTFAKSVVLDLDEVENNKDNYTYYNVFPGTIFVKDGADYSVNYLDKKLKFTNFILKINNEKFLIIGNKINVKIGDNVKTLENNYVEVSYLDGNVIKIDNQGVSFQSVSDEVIIEIGDGVAIDFVQKNIYKDTEKKISLGEITVDSDDNIPISSDENSSITGEIEDSKTDSKNSKSDSNGNNGGNSNKKYTKEELPSMSSGVVDTSTNDLEEIIDANARVQDADFKIANMDVNANRLTAAVSITDNAAVLEGPINIKIIETNTNKIVYEINDDSGSNYIDIENDALTPETNYILVINSDYKKNNVTYNKDFIQKTFVTDAIGVSLERYLISESQLQVNIKKGAYSDVASVDVALEDSAGTTLKTQTVSLNSGDNIVDFSPLENDTKYKVRVYNFVYQDSVVTNGFTILKTYETLKRRPAIGSTTFSMDKKEGKFNMYMNNIMDPDGGVISYKYEVYDARTIDEPNSQPITVLEKNNNASASLKVDGVNIKRGIPYVFRVVMTFNDNEKEYDYVTEYSDVMKMDGVTFPTVKFNKSEVTFERIVGDIEIIDEDNTINLNDGSIIKVTYTSSVGESKTITSSGSLVIPISEAVGLRSNETYTFSVMATVDLQDGNPPIDSCYIGSVIVKTEDPNPFRMEFNQLEDPSHVFTIDAQLLRKDKTTELEANTLTGITFNLYQGRGTSGRLVKSIKEKDLNDDHYVSDLRAAYYDTQFRIDPSFFGMKNSDLTAEYYTIEVTGAYDYTVFPNTLPIDNNTVTVKSTNALPDLPDNPTDSVDIIPISNRDHEQRPDLDDGTVVGYFFRAAYNNDAKYAKKIIYEIHDATTDELIQTIPYIVPPSGEINYSEIYLGDGIASRITDNTLRRGQPFYIVYELDLDTNYDDTVDLIYPPETVILRSKIISPFRQEPIINMYPSKSSSTTYTWKYTYSDVDHTLVSNQIYMLKDGAKIDTKPLTITNNYREVVFENIGKGLLSIYGDYNFVNTNDASKYSLTSQYYEGVISNADFGRVNIDTSDNRVTFTFLDYAAKEELFNKVSNIKIEFTAGSKTITIDGLRINSSMITINYSQLDELMGKTITPKIIMYYDSGIYGFDNSGDVFAIQQVRNTVDGRYYYYYENNVMKSSITAEGSYLNYELDFPRNNLTFINKYDNSRYQSSFFINHFGLNFDSNYISPKKLSTAIATLSNAQSFTFNEIIPCISLLDDNNKSTISPLIDMVSFKITPYIGEDQLKNEKVYIELYKTINESGSEAELVSTSEYRLSELNNNITIGSLIPQTNYYFMVSGDVLTSGGTYERMYLYDIDQKKSAVHYYFKTIGNVGISNIHVRYSASSYSNRYFYLTYNLEETIGYTYIQYKVYKILGEDEELFMDRVVTQNDTLFKNSMVSRLIIPNTSGVTTSNTYRIEIQPVLTTTVNGELTDINLESASTTYNFNTLYKPYFIINQTASATSFNLRVNVKDYHKVIVGGKYTIQLLDSSGADVTPNQYKNQEFSISTANRLFELGYISANSRYQLIINYSSDIYNDSTRISNSRYVYTFATNQLNEVSLGEVYADTDMSDTTKVNLRFFNSYQLTKIKSIRYSIYNESGYSVDNQASFVPSLVQSNDTTYYEYRLPTSINADGIYYIAMQFLNENGVIIAEDTVEYRLL